MGELCYDAKSQSNAIKAIRKEKTNYELKIKMLIDIEAWLEAVEEVFLIKKKTEEFNMWLEILRQKAPPFIEDFIRDQENKKK